MCAKYTRNSNGEDLHFLKLLNDCLKQISSCFTHFYLLRQGAYYKFKLMKTSANVIQAFNLILN